MSNKHRIEPVHGPTNPASGERGIQRFASVIGLKPEMEQRYRELHADAWVSVITRLKESNVRNYSIYIAELGGAKYLFSYFEYVGNDLQRDMQSIGDDPETQRWWAETDPCQIQLPGRSPGANWTDLERVFLLV